MERIHLIDKKALYIYMKNILLHLFSSVKSANIIQFLSSVLFYVAINGLVNINAYAQVEDALKEERSQSSISSLARFVADTTAWNYHNTKTLMVKDVYYDLDGAPVAYVFAYSLDGTKKPLTITTEQIENFKQQKVEVALHQSVQTQTEAQEKEEAVAELKALERNLRFRDDLVTIIVSASPGTKPVLDRFFGIPHHVYKEKLYLKSTSSSANKAEYNVVMVSPKELYFAPLVTDEVQDKGSAISTGIAKAISNANQLISVNSGDAVSINVIREAIAKEKSNTQGGNGSTDINSQWEMYIGIFDAKGVGK